MGSLEDLGFLHDIAEGRPVNWCFYPPIDSVSIDVDQYTFEEFVV
jgi:hypothetical protein